MLLGMDGGDHYGNSATPMLAGVYAAAGIPPSTSRPRNGTHSFRQTSVAGAENRRVITQGAQSVFGLGMAWFVDNLPDDDKHVLLQRLADNTNNSLCYLLLLPTGAIQLAKGVIISRTVLAETAAGVMTAGEFNHIEAKYVFAGAAGAVEIRRNGVTVMDVTGVDIGAAAQCAIFAYGVAAGTWGGAEYCIDDVFWWNDAGTVNNDFQGDKVVLFLQPSSDQVASAWTRNTGANDFETIDDLAPDGDATYVQATDPGDVSEYGFTNLPAEIVEVAGLCVYTYGRKTDSGDGSVEVSLLSAASVDAGAEHAFGESYAYFVDVYETDPATGAPWLTAAVDAATLRLERTT